MYKPKSKRLVETGSVQKKNTLNGLMANKNIDDIRALANLSNAQSSEIKTIKDDLITIDSEITDLQNNKQDNITLTTIGSSGPSTFINDTLNVPDYSSAPWGLYAQTGSSTRITNTTVETSLMGSGVGTLSVPANGFQVGDSFLVVLTGHISSINNHTLHIRIKSNGLALVDTGIITMPATTLKHWKLDVDFTIRAIGPSGVAAIASGGSFIYTKNASNAFEGANFSTEITTGFDTTISNTLEITAQWGTASASDSIYSEIFTLNKIF
jgi:hypothetical protein